MKGELDGVATEATMIKQGFRRMNGGKNKMRLHPTGADISISGCAHPNQGVRIWTC